MFLKALILLGRCYSIDTESKLNFLAFVATGAFAQLAPNCPSTNLNACTQQYFAPFLNYPNGDNNTAIWLDYATFINFTDQLFSQNVGDPTGLVTVCKLVSYFYNATNISI